MKYLVFRALPFLGVVCAMSVALIWATALYNTFPEWITTLVMSAITILCHLAYYAYHSIRFSKMIKKQELQYQTVFDNIGAKTLSLSPFWTVCSDKWLIVPAKFAIFKQEIKSVSLGESYSHPKGGIIYPVKIKTRSGKTFKLKFGDDTRAKALRTWARR